MNFTLTATEATASVQRNLLIAVKGKDAIIRIEEAGSFSLSWMTWEFIHGSGRIEVIFGPLTEGRTSPQTLGMLMAGTSEFGTWNTGNFQTGGGW